MVRRVGVTSCGDASCDDLTRIVHGVTRRRACASLAPRTIWVLTAYRTTPEDVQRHGREDRSAAPMIVPGSTTGKWRGHPAAQPPRPWRRCQFQRTLGDSQSEARVAFGEKDDLAARNVRSTSQVLGQRVTHHSEYGRSAAWDCPASEDREGMARSKGSGMARQCVASQAD